MGGIAPLSSIIFLDEVGARMCIVRSTMRYIYIEVSFFLCVCDRLLVFFSLTRSITGIVRVE